jgi:hypothetical protein
LTICTVFYSVSARIDEDYERIVVMKYEKELEAKFGKSRYARKIYSFKIFLKKIFPLKSACINVLYLLDRWKEGGFSAPATPRRRNRFLKPSSR